MPRRVGHPCGWSGCSRIVQPGERFCDAHKTAFGQMYDAERGSPRERGYDQRHAEWRAAVLARDRFCQMCPANRRQRAIIADHIIPLKVFQAQGREPEAWLLSNGQGLCKSCHARKTARETHYRRTHG